MGNYIQILAFVTIGIVLLWFGYTLLIGQLAGIHLGWLRWQKREKYRRSPGTPGDPQVCPVCSARLDKGQLVKSLAFPSVTGGKDRLMHIRGCVYCIGGDRPRICPVCGISLRSSDILISRMFERPRRSHVHVIGCSRCRRVGSLLK
jgi:Zn-finger nucleic acid-binding protein